MSASVELRRLLSEWSLRLKRVQNILQPPTWSGEEWRAFSQGLALLVRRHGANWAVETKVYWDLRWKVADGGELICQVEHIPEEKTTLIVAQSGGFAAEAGSYTWLWAEFGMDGNFSREPYWVEGTWREALMTLLMPYQQQAGYYLEQQVATPTALLEQGTRPSEEILKETEILEETLGGKSS